MVRDFVQHHRVLPTRSRSTVGRSSASRSDREVCRQIRRVVLHEVAHHFGISDERLEELGRY